VIDVSLNFDALKLNWVIDIVVYTWKSQYYNLGHLGADLSIQHSQNPTRCFQKKISGRGKHVYPLNKFFFLLPIWAHCQFHYDVKRRSHHVIERPAHIVHIREILPRKLGIPGLVWIGGRRIDLLFAPILQEYLYWRLRSVRSDTFPYQSQHTPESEYIQYLLIIIYESRYTTIFVNIFGMSYTVMGTSLT
jgi:hypothetical protein